MGPVGGGADIRAVEYLADIYLHSGRNIARVTGPGRMLAFYGGRAIVRDLRDVLWALQQPDVVVQPTSRYWEFMPEWIRAVRDPAQGGREANAIVAGIVLPEGWHVGLPPDYALWHERDAAPVPYGWETPEPPPPPSSPEAHCANPDCGKLLSPHQLKRNQKCCGTLCNLEMKRRDQSVAVVLPAQPCAYCGEPFTPRWRKTKDATPYLTRYCGTACARRAQGTAKRVNMAHTSETRSEESRRQSTAAPATCAHCGGLFKPYPNHGKLTRYCSRACSQAESVPKMLAGLAEHRGATP